jgi:hypothetical protein
MQKFWIHLLNGSLNQAQILNYHYDNLILSK